MKHITAARPNVPQLVTVYVAVIIAWLAYVLLQLYAPTATVTSLYHIVPFEYQLIRASVFLPILAIWLVSVYGAVTFMNYGRLLGQTYESKAIRLISYGLYWTLGYFIVSSLLGSLLQFYTASPGYEALVILKDHLVAWLTLITFFLFYRGATHLRLVANFNIWTRGAITVTALYLIFAVLLAWQFSMMPSFPTTANLQSSIQYIHPYILLFTLLLPYLVGWFFGVVALISIAKYAAAVKGSIYRKSLRDLVTGLWAVMAFSILAQLVQVAARSLISLPLAPLLLLIYALVILYGISYIFIARGARKLAKIEVVQ